MSDEPYLAYWGTRADQQRWMLPADPEPGGVTIGRSSTADVRIDWDEKVSRVHATLARIGAEWTLEDDGLSRNGTYVNGRRISTRVRLRDRDKIMVGETVLTFCAPPQTASQQTVVGDAMPAVTLTNAQRAVLVALCRPYGGGHPYAAPASNQQIADELSLSVDAVKTHLRVLFQKFGIEALPQNRKRAQLVEMAMTIGLVAEQEL